MVRECISYLCWLQRRHLPTEAIALRWSVQRLHPCLVQDVGTVSQEAGTHRDGIVVLPFVDGSPHPPDDLVEIVMFAPPQSPCDPLQSAVHPLYSELAIEPESAAPGHRALVREAQ